MEKFFSGDPAEPIRKDRVTDIRVFLITWLSQSPAVRPQSPTMSSGFPVNFLVLHWQIQTHENFQASGETAKILFQIKTSKKFLNS
jgi:hypothetical protein